MKEEVDQTKRLYRSDNAMIAGVVAGLAEYFQIDASLLRIIAVILVVLFIGAPLLLYLLCIFIIPRHPQDISRPIEVKPSSSGELPIVNCSRATPGAAYISSNSRVFTAVDPQGSGQSAPQHGWRRSRGLSTALTLGVLLVCLGVLALLSLLLDSRIWRFWPMVLVLTGLLTLFTPGYEGWKVSRAGYSILLITIGILLQLWKLNFFPVTTFIRMALVLWPVGIVALGLMIIGGALRMDILKLLAALLVAMALMVGVWVFGPVAGPYDLTMPWGDHFYMRLPEWPFR